MTIIIIMHGPIEVQGLRQATVSTGNPDPTGDRCKNVHAAEVARSPKSAVVPTSPIKTAADADGHILQYTAAG